MKLHRAITVVPAATVVVAATIALAGCAVGPDYQRPEVTVPMQFRSPVGTEPVAKTTWWGQFGDPVLDGLVREAVASNQDVAIAAARVEQFYGVWRGTRSQLFPQVGAEMAGSRARASESTVSPAPGRNPYTASQADVFLSWEIDLFGRIRRETEAAQADWAGAEEARRGTLVAVVAAVVNGYVTLRDLDRQLAVSRDTLASRSDAFALFEKRYKGGVVSQVEYYQAGSEYAAALRDVPRLEQQVAAQEHALSVLLGRLPGPVERGLPIEALPLPTIPAGLPSELLERRPDLRQAEQALIAANARIGAAKALYFPTISLTGLYGQAATSLSNLWTGPARAWSYAGSLTVPIFTAGGIGGQVAAAEGGQREALAAYRRAIQVAFQETEDALVGVQRSRDARDAQAQQVDMLRTYARLSRLRYESGYTSYLEVLDSERSLFNAEIQLARAQAETIGQHVALYKALGGDWVDGVEGAPVPQGAAAAASAAGTP